jgi:hypothetical protein
MGATVKDKNRAIRQEVLREQLQQKGLHTQVLVIADKLNNEYLTLEASNINALKASADLKMKLINKYMPDLKNTELTGADGGPIETANKIEWSIHPVKAINEA